MCDYFSVSEHPFENFENYADEYEAFAEDDEYLEDYIIFEWELPMCFMVAMVTRNMLKKKETDNDIIRQQLSYSVKNFKYLSKNLCSDDEGRIYNPNHNDCISMYLKEEELNDNFFFLNLIDVDDEAEIYEISPLIS